ncbi:MAG: hypothetical protein R3C05_04900 [Pirellulaceae bacterium]
MDRRRPSEFTQSVPKPPMRLSGGMAVKAALVGDIEAALRLWRWSAYGLT